ncbi:transposase [Kitasatospora sp. NPDC057500]|uniref:transposase n=1 Tax=Kitasatospora sp. NPDC057500 TaxID=3346151 RepID=UPI0036CD8D77
MITDGLGTPLAVTATGGNRHDVTRLVPLMDVTPRLHGRTGRPRHRPQRLFADQGYGFDEYRRLVWKRDIERVIARRGVLDGSEPCVCSPKAHTRRPRRTRAASRLLAAGRVQRVERGGQHGRATRRAARPSRRAVPGFRAVVAREAGARA